MAWQTGILNLLRHQDLPLAAALPTLVAIGLVAVGLGTWDYHLAVAVAPATAWALAWEVAATASGHSPARPLRVLLALLGPFLVTACAAPWMPSCNFWDSLAWWGIGPIGSALWGGGVGAVVALGLPNRWRGNRLALTLGLIAVFVTACLPGAVWFLAHPQVFGYAPPVGRIAGALYEDAVAVQWRDVAYRLADVGLTLPIAALLLHVRRAQLPWRLASLRVLQRTGVPVGLYAAVAVLALAVGAQRAAPERWRIADEDLARALPRQMVVRDDYGQVAATLHLPGQRKLRHAGDLVVQDCAFRYRQLASWFGHDIDGLQIFVWPDSAAKRAWTGAHRVEMAKPWLRQIHVVLPDYGASVLAHEMAHVFAARWAPGPLGVPLRHGWLPDAVAIEGVAVAAEWPNRSGLDPHQWARAARVLGKAPPLDAMLSPSGFFRQNTEMAYTLAGSLFRYVAEVHGRPALARAYRDGDLAAATGLRGAELLQRWAAFVDDAVAHPLGPDDLERARARFAPPGLFDRPCALAVGRCRDRAGALHTGGNERQARDLVQAMAERLNPRGPLELSLAIEVQAAIASAGHPRAAAAALAARLTDEVAAPALRRLNPLQRASLVAVTGDLWWHAGDVGAARQAWGAALAAPFDEGTLRTLVIKVAWADQPAAAETLASLLTLGGAVGDAQDMLDRLHLALPDDPLATYLWARRALRLAGDDPALPAIAQLVPQLAAWPLVAREVNRLWALALARRGECPALRMVDVHTEPQSFQAELAERCAFAASAANRSPAGD